MTVSDRPRFISGRLGVEIRAGLYPKQLTSYQSLHKLLSNFSAGNSRPGTLIELPFNDSAAKDVLSQFNKLSGVLTVFSKRIRSIDLIKSEEERERVEWLPENVLSTADAHLEKGVLPLYSDKGKKQIDALHFRCMEGGGLLIGIDARGLVPLPENDFPPVWIVSPTREKGRLGFCINGEFEVDAGRARLAGESGKNKTEARRIGQLVGKVCCILFEKTEENWSDMREKLRLLPDLSHYAFWESAWVALTDSWHDSSDKHLDSEVFGLVSNLLSSHAGLGLLIRDKKALPNGLWGEEFQRLISPGEIRYVLRDSLSERIIFEPLSRWQLLREKLDPETVISAKIFPALGKILPGFIQKKDQWQSLRLPQVIHWLKERGYQIDPAGAEVLGRVITREFLDKLPATLEGESEYKNLVHELKKLKFQTQDGGWHENSMLLRFYSSGAGDDEPLRAAFAPIEKILHSTYRDAALDFFIVCRGEMSANTLIMANWVLAAETDQQRQSALEYLVNGEHGDQVAWQLRIKGTENSWLADLRSDSVYFERLSDEEIKELLYRKLPSLSTLENRWQEYDDYYEQETTVIPPVDVPGTLRNIYDWWQNNQDEYLTKYEDRTYPDRGLLSGLHDDDRSSWLTVLLIGSFHTFGRAKPEQHRNFLALCRQKGWWDIFTQENPKKHPDAWMGILEEYIDDQEEDSKFEYWMRLFPTIYKFARELEDYIEIFYELEKQGKEVNVLQTMASRTFSDFQGGGVAAAPIARTLGMGVPFVLREMLRKDLFDKNQENIAPYCYVPLGLVRNFFGKMGCSGLENNESHLVKSEMIYDFLCQHLGPDRAHFDKSFDIPFQYVAEDLELQEELFVL